MSETIILSISISLVGMGLVFGAILLLWLLIDLLVTATRERSGYLPSEADPATDNRRKAAAIAVAYALAEQEARAVNAFPLPPTATVSAWQSVMRSNQIKKRGTSR